MATKEEFSSFLPERRSDGIPREITAVSDIALWCGPHSRYEAPPNMYHHALNSLGQFKRCKSYRWASELVIRHSWYLAFRSTRKITEVLVYLYLYFASKLRLKTIFRSISPNVRGLKRTLDYKIDTVYPLWYTSMNPPRRWKEAQRVRNILTYVHNGTKHA